MPVYRFRVYIEDDHEVYRDIDVLGRQRFADLHREVVKSFNFKLGEAAEYFSSDQQWYEGDSVVGLDKNLDGDHQKIVDHISMPRQRFLCVTVSYKEVGLALELQKVLPEEPEVVYPRCSRSQGEPPYYTQPPPEPIIDSGTESASHNDEFEDDDDGPSEAEIAKIQRDAEKASKKGELKTPKIDFALLSKNSSRRKVDDEDLVDADDDDLDDEDDEDEDDENNNERGFESFDMDDLM